MNKTAVMLFAALLIAGCASAPQPQAESARAKPAEQEPGAGTPPAAELGVPTETGVSAVDTLEAAKDAALQGLQDKSIYFDFDMFVVKPEYRDLLQEHAAILRAHPNGQLTLEGNADERGSPEYNLAIGYKRARAVQAQLILLGIAASRIQEVSFGEERPRATCHEEKCWQQNRRVDFVYR